MFKCLAGYFKPYWRNGILIAAGLLMEMGFNSLVPFSFKFIVDDGLGGNYHALLINIVTGLAIGAVVVSAAGLGRDYLYAKLATSVLGDIRYRMFHHLQRLSMDFYARAKTGDILSRFSGDLSAVEAAMANALPWGVLPALDVAANTVLLFVLDWRLALVAMLVWPLALFGPRFFAPRAVKASYARKQDEGRTMTAVQENIASQQVVKALGLLRSELPLHRLGLRGRGARYRAGRGDHQRLRQPRHAAARAVPLPVRRGEVPGLDRRG